MSNKTIKIYTSAPVRSHYYTLLPIGLYCNREIQTASRGSVVIFQDSWNMEKRILKRSCKVKVNSEVFTFLVKSLYRGFNTKDGLFGRWEAECEIQGIGKNAFSREEVLLIEVEDIK